jgi:hypothetical protein
MKNLILLCGLLFATYSISRPNNGGIPKSICQAKKEGCRARAKMRTRALTPERKRLERRCRIKYRACIKKAKKLF